MSELPVARTRRVSWTLPSLLLEAVVERLEKWDRAFVSHFDPKRSLIGGKLPFQSNTLAWAHSCALCTMNRHCSTAN